MVLNEIKTRYGEADSPGLCIKSDGTRDRCNIENLSVIIRFVHNSIPEEHLIGLIQLNQLDAAYATRSTSCATAAKSIVHNEDVIRRLLSEISGDDSAPFDLNTEACGLLAQLKRQNFFDTGKFLLHVLGVLKPANSILQSQTVDLCTAGEVVTASLGTLKEMRCDSFWEEHFSQCGSRPSKRRRVVNSQLDDSVILSTIGHDDSDDLIAPNQTFKKAMLNILDRAIVEMETRFSKRNIDLMRATSFLLPKAASFLDPSLLKPLQVLAATEQNDVSLQNEIAVAKTMLLNKLSTDANLSEACRCIQQYKEAFPILHKLYVTALIIGVSSAACSFPQV
ncbi:hypothetical protein N1851_021900 [Merluccius polli]|uniref:Uncharacterized protein n=1 Tax=Merluccius polli TaxID=89951 RepID=A0AA47MIT9_MERPO|nr:hypothetical protein N1851_021900 [Merluccius polli]